jgi:hypothetical protein
LGFGVAPVGVDEGIADDLAAGVMLAGRDFESSETPTWISLL